MTNRLLDQVSQMHIGIDNLHKTRSVSARRCVGIGFDARPKSRQS